MKYENLTDIEINARVSRALYGDVSRGHQMELASGAVDYCNRIEDAWPVITGNNISIVATDLEWIALPDNAVIDGITGDATSMIYVDDSCVIGTNPLRSAMIVFLRMYEVDK